jgi:hypothetical protein
MSISPAQLLLQAASLETPVSTRRSTPAPVLSPAPVVGSPSEAPAPAPAIASPTSFSTDRQVDDHHQVYYEFVDKSTGDVVFEIPPAALREIGESLNLPMVGESSSHDVDLKS